MAEKTFTPCVASLAKSTIPGLKQITIRAGSKGKGQVLATAPVRGTIKKARMRAMGLLRRLPGRILEIQF